MDCCNTAAQALGQPYYGAHTTFNKRCDYCPATRRWRQILRTDAMMTISPCTSPSFLLNPSPCAPSSSPTSPAFKATLSRPDLPTVQLTAALLPSGQLQVAIPTPFPTRGIWQLSVGTPTCSCFSARVYIDTCTPMANVPTHTATGDTQSTATTPVQVCCP
jgi:hypothetical protein